MSNYKSNNKRRNYQNKQNKQNNFCSFCNKSGKNPFGHTIKNCNELKMVECRNCGKTGHTIRYCPFIEKCKFCERVGHTEEKCFYNPKNKVEKCGKCKKFGHSYIDCYYLSKEERETYIKEKEDKENKEKEKKEKELHKKDNFQKKGFTYDEKYLRNCKEMLEKDPNYIPWVVYDNNDYNPTNTELTKNEKKTLNDILIQISMLD